MRVHRGLRRGEFPVEDLFPGGTLAAVAFGDLEGDGRLDAVASRLLVPEVVVIRGTPPAAPGYAACGEDPTPDALEPCGGSCP